MSAYWDSSAVVAACLDDDISQIFWSGVGHTRSHTFAEVFSTLTGGRLGFRVDADEAATLIADLAAHLQTRDLTRQEILSALSEARARGVRGGRVHDYFHAAAAVALKCVTIVTYNVVDFEGLYPGLKILTPEELGRA